MEIYGKKIVFLGDSITEGVGTSAPDKRYFEIIAQKTGAKCIGYGISGTRIAKNRVPSEEASFDLWFNSRVKDLDKDSDIIAIFGGTNDYGHGDAALGSIEDTTEDTFYGGLNVLYANLMKTFPNARIVIMTPSHRLFENNIYNDVGVRNQTNLTGYVNIIKEVANKFGLPIIDMFGELGINPQIEEQKELFMPDGLHPSDLGNEKIADFFIAKIKAL